MVVVAKGHYESHKWITVICFSFNESPVAAIHAFCSFNDKEASVAVTYEKVLKKLQ